jgi:hypothetical protein
LSRISKLRVVSSMPNTSKYHSKNNTLLHVQQENQTKPRKQTLIFCATLHIARGRTLAEDKSSACDACVCVCACVSCVKICWDFNHHSEVLRDWWAIFCAALPSPPMSQCVGAHPGIHSLPQSTPMPTWISRRIFEAEIWRSNFDPQHLNILSLCRGDARIAMDQLLQATMAQQWKLQAQVEGLQWLTSGMTLQCMHVLRIMRVYKFNIDIKYIYIIYIYSYIVSIWFNLFYAKKAIYTHRKLSPARGYWGHGDLQQHIANHSNICITSHPQSERGHSNGNLNSGLWPQGADHGDSYCGPTCTNRNKLSSRTSWRKLEYMDDYLGTSWFVLYTCTQITPPANSWLLGCSWLHVPVIAHVLKPRGAAGPTQLPPRSLFRAPSSSSAFQASFRLACPRGSDSQWQSVTAPPSYGKFSRETDH